MRSFLIRQERDISLSRIPKKKKIIEKKISSSICKKQCESKKLISFSAHFSVNSVFIMTKPTAQYKKCLCFYFFFVTHKKKTKKWLH